MKKNLNKDFIKIHEFYVGDFIKTMGKKYHINPQELLDIWNESQRPTPLMPKQEKPCLNTRRHDVNEHQKQKLWNSLHVLKHEDLSRHCIKNGIQPPLQKEDMIKAIVAKVYRS